MATLVKKKTSFDKDDFEFVKREMIKAIAKDDDGNMMFNPEKYNKMCRIVYSKNGKPENMAIKIKRKVNDEIIEEEVLTSDYTVQELAKLIAESAALGDYSLFSPDEEDVTLAEKYKEKYNNLNMKKISSEEEGYTKSKELKFKTNKKEFVIQFKTSTENNK